jgi:hypothetical protein
MMTIRHHSAASSSFPSRIFEATADYEIPSIPGFQLRERIQNRPPDFQKRRSYFYLIATASL